MNIGVKIRPLQKDLQEKAIRELNEDPKRIQEVLDQVTEWLQKQPHLNVRNDDQMTVAFLRGCKWNLQLAKDKLDAFYSVKTAYPELFQNRDPLSPAIQKVLDAGIIFPMPNPNNYMGPVFTIYNLRDVDENVTPLIETLKVLFMNLEILLMENDNMSISGITGVMDYSECPVSYYLQFTPFLMKDFFKCLRNAYPLRVKEYAMCNTLTIFERIFNTFMKPFLGSKLQKRIQVPNKEQSKQFLNQFPRNLLPAEYGGTNGSMKDVAEQWKKKVESYREWFLDDAKYVTKLRVDKSKTIKDGVITDGTFRNLVID